MSHSKRNFSILISGMTGSGKTQFVLRLVKVSPRLIIFDPQAEYEVGAVFNNFHDASQFFAQNHAQDFQMTVREPDNLDREGRRLYYLNFLELVYTAQMSDPESPPVGIVLEEVSFYTDTGGNPPASLEKIYTKGRHARISIIANAQRLTQVNPILRDQSHVWVLLRSKSLPTDGKARFSKEEIDRMAELETITPDVTPKKGVHYLSDLDGADIIEEWRDTLKTRHE